MKDNEEDFEYWLENTIENQLTEKYGENSIKYGEEHYGEAERLTKEILCDKELLKQKEKEVGRNKKKRNKNELFKKCFKINKI